MKQKKTKRIFLRLTEEELNEIRKRSNKFQSITQYVFAAIHAFEDTTIQEKMEMSKRLAEFYVKADEKLGHIGGNLNQAMRQVNEASKIGTPTYALLINRLMPEIIQCYQLCAQLRKELLTETQKATNQ